MRCATGRPAIGRSIEVWCNFGGRLARDLFKLRNVLTASGDRRSCGAGSDDDEIITSCHLTRPRASHVHRENTGGQAHAGGLVGHVAYMEWSRIRHWTCWAQWRGTRTGRPVRHRAESGRLGPMGATEPGRLAFSRQLHAPWRRMASRGKTCQEDPARIESALQRVGPRFAGADRPVNEDARLATTDADEAHA